MGALTTLRHPITQPTLFLPLSLPFTLVLSSTHTLSSFSLSDFLSLSTATSTHTLSSFPLSDFLSLSTATSKKMAEGGNVIEIDGERRPFPLSEVVELTRNFAEDLVIGSGGFGKVYRASLVYAVGDNGGQRTKKLAIKRLNAESNQGVGEFWNEIHLLSSLRHPHLVSLLGYCDEPPEMILVYEYVDNGSLAGHLYNSSLTWEHRLQICIGAARGLEYLHAGKDFSPVIHRDVKSTNILLDAEWVSKICDFGLCKTPPTQSSTHVTTEVKGTIGYVDPEYFLTTKLTPKSDVYSFGIVLLEVLCGRKAVDTQLETEKVGLAQWVQQCMSEGTLDTVVDPFVRAKIGPQCLGDFAELARTCLEPSSKNRPTMAEVLERLERLETIRMFGGPDTVEEQQEKAPNSSNDSPTSHFFCCFKRRGQSRS